MDKWTETETNILYGVVTTGTEWQFGRFDRTRRHITQDLKLYRIPEELTTLIQILLALLT
ncbi:hypothetical protein [Limnofasciculus baicalensis]|uniref:Uncharacterized protein n=1 Tax=Limnofasciculus baicalensis BBK-W-15 TaxID=2699891 RepID=A0AAE3GUT7_9CYAN|nr:hypothetical protein [Limnofasciculus baicalensis]MCP2730779.1 hypothetical protein [Limnofasciculus baicalensis BBK-W-15]